MNALRMLIGLSFLALMLAAGPALADGHAEAADDGAAEAPEAEFTFDARERARFELRSTADEPDWWIENLASVGVGVTVGSVYGRVEVRANHNWGADGTVGSVALQQAYGGVAMDNGMDLRIGRQALNWHNGRLLSDQPWRGEGQSFDAINFNFGAEKAGVSAFYAKLAETSGQHLIGVAGGPRLGDSLSLDGVALIDLDSDTETTKATVGVNASGSAGIVGYGVEAYGQLGSMGDTMTYNGWMIGVRVGVTPETSVNLSVGGGVDVLSGDNDDDASTMGEFSTPYGARHAFLGHFDSYDRADGGAGLIDGMFLLGLNPYEGMRLELAVHAFAGMDDSGLQGAEIDIDMAWSAWDAMDLTAGVWISIPAADGADPVVAAVMGSEFNF